MNLSTKNKAFTLIELLAVIVILGIIMLISTPLIINVINDARKGSFKNSTYGIIKAAENQHLKMMMGNKDFDELSFSYIDGVESSNAKDGKLDYRGTKPDSGTVVINKEGKIGIAIHNGKWCAEKGFEDSTVELTKKSKDECKLTVIPPKEDVYEDESGSPIPVLDEGMIPIMWDESKWIKADKTKKWYDYNNKEWANVVLVTEATRNDYIDGAPGTEIKEADILAYLVWIPRYKYKLFNVDAIVSSPQEIEIAFESSVIAKSDGSTNGTYLTHPAFTFGDDELSGFWVGKFETSAEEGSPCFVTPSIGNCNVGTINPRIKPNVNSLRFQSISMQFATNRKFNNYVAYGLTSELDAHMLKNIEWGAVTYLSHSKYGKNEKIWINPSSTYITGCAGTGPSVSKSAGCAHAYTTTNGVQASTTGNVTGVYDMSGGAYEYVMSGTYNSDNSTIIISSSGFVQATLNSAEMSKYIDKYGYGTTFRDQVAYNRRILGDATGETRGWYGDAAYFVHSGYPWFYRGGNTYDCTGFGAFCFSNNNGTADSVGSSRIAMPGLRP